MDIFIYILTRNILPLVLIIIIGFILSKKFNLNISTLSKIMFYVYVPFFIFIQIYTTQLPKEILKILAFVVILAIVNYAITAMTAKLRGYDEGFKNAFPILLCFIIRGI